MPSFWKHVNSVLKQAELVIEVLDARMVEESRNVEIERKIRKLEKKILYVITKCDLVNVKELGEKLRDLKPSVFISSKDHFGTTLLKKKILQISRGESIVVGIVGYPNVGKSSLINALAGKGKAKTSAESGYTKGLQKIRVDSKIVVLDTPGVFPKDEKDRNKYAKIGAIDYAKIKDPDLAAIKIITDEKELIQKYYGINLNDPEEILEKIGEKFGKLRKGGKIDLDGAARFLLKEWQQGKIKNKA